MATNDDGTLNISPSILERTIIFLGFWPVIVTFAFFGNILTLLVLHRVNAIGTTGIYLKNLAVADLLTLCVKATCIVFNWWQMYRTEQYNTWKVNTLSIVTLGLVFERVSKYTTVAIVSERIIAITWPFRYREFCTPFRTKLAIAVIYVIVFAVALPLSIDVFSFFHTTEPRKEEYPMAMKEGTRYLTEHLYSSPGAFLLNKIARAMDFIPIPLIITGNIVIITGLRKGTSVRSISTDAQQQRKIMERKTTKLCLTISVTFLILCSPYDILNFLFLSKIIEFNHVVQVLGDVFVSMSLINSSVNFIIYAVMNTQYRQGYAAILTCWKRN